MNQRVVEINKKRIILSERITEDVLSLGEFVDRNEQKQNAISFIAHVASVMITHSIKQSRKNFRWFQIFKKMYYLRYSRTYLMKNISLQDMFFLQNVIFDLEGVSKKKVEAETKESPDSNLSS
jgi:hypothetical protein